MLQARSQENIPVIAAASVVTALFFAWLAPSEATLGNAVKLVYVHAALMWVGFFSVTIGGLAGLVFVVWRRPELIRWGGAFSATGVGLMFLTGLLGFITAQVTWGGMNWREPRLLMLIEIVLAGLVVILLGSVWGPSMGSALAYLGFAVLAWVLVIRTELVMHPSSPIFSSESTAIRIFPLLITAFLAIAGFQAVRYWAISSSR